MIPQTRSTATVHQGRVFRLDTETVDLKPGITIDLDIIRHPGAAAMLPVTEDGNIRMLHQYRHAAGCRMWEIPAGTLEPGEKPESCAHRELREEIGYDAQRLDKLGELMPVPGYSDERLFVYLATGLVRSPLSPDADELLEVRDQPFEQVLSMIDSGEIFDAKTVYAVFLAMRRFAHRLPHSALTGI